MTSSTASDHKPSILIVDDDEVYRNAPGARVRRPRLRRADRAATTTARVAAAHADSPESRSSTSRCPARAGSSWSRRCARSIRRRRRSCSPATAASRPRSTRSASARRTTCPSRPTPTTSSTRSRAARQPPLEPGPATDDYKAPSLARAEWEHINRVLSRRRRQHLRGGAPARHPPPQPAAQAPEVSAQGLGSYSPMPACACCTMATAPISTPAATIWYQASAAPKKPHVIATAHTVCIISK